MQLVPPAPADPVVLATIGDATANTDATPATLPAAIDLAGGIEPLEIGLAAGVRLDVELLQPLPLAFVGTSALGIGRHSATEANHEWVPRFARFVWDDEIGYGCIEHSAQLTA